MQIILMNNNDDYICIDFTAQQIYFPTCAMKYWYKMIRSY